MTRPLLLAAALALLASLPAQAQYKVIGPDGKVTYTDRPTTSQPGSVAPVRVEPPAQSGTSGPPLPLELRQVAQRFPVVLYAAPDCPPCDSARRLLKQRGIPHNERQVFNNDEIPALERATGGRALPAITVGGQSINGYGEGQWNSLLDLAGYPRESRLPRDYAAAPATPLVARPAAPIPRPAEPAPTPEAEPAAPPAAASGIRF